MNRRLTKFVIISLLLAALIALPAGATSVVKQLAPGVVFSQEIDIRPESALILNSISVDPSCAEIHAALGKDVIDVADSTKGRETISSLVARRGALLGVNADYFPFTGDPLGMCIVNGELASEPNFNRSVFAISSDKTAFIDNPRMNASVTLANGILRQIDGINRPRDTNQIIVYTQTYGASTRSKYRGTDIVMLSGDLPVSVGKTINATVTDIRVDATDTTIPKGGLVLSAGGPAALFCQENIKPGDKVSLRFDITSQECYDWSRVREAVGGGPWIVKDGKQFIDFENEGWKADFSTTRHPRTAIGITANNKILIATVDGRQFISKGASLAELSALMIKLGAVNAMNLDGGGSTTLAYRGAVMNSPSDGNERPVANALLVFATPTVVAEPKSVSITGLAPETYEGQGTQLSIAADGNSLPQEQLSSVVWGTTNGIGFVNQKGYFTPSKAGKGTIYAFLGKQCARLDINVIPVVSAKIEISIEPDEYNPLRAQVIVRVLNSTDAPLKNQQVTITAIGGKPDKASGTTDQNGQFVTCITWDAQASARSVSATSGNISGEAAGP